MNKNELIEQLQQMEGNPEVYIKVNGFATVPIDIVEPALVEGGDEGGEVFTFSDTPERRKAEPGLQPAILIWTDN